MIEPDRRQRHKVVNLYRAVLALRFALAKVPEIFSRLRVL